MELKIEIGTFYKIGIFCFAVTALSNIANFVIYASITNVFSKVGSVAGIIFNVVLCLLFYSMLKNEPKIAKGEVKADGIEELLEKIR